MAPRRILPPGFVEPCIPALAAKPPTAPGWVHEIKHDGYRLIVRGDGDTMRLFTRRGHDWTERYPAIATAAAKLRARSFTMDAVRDDALATREPGCGFLPGRVAGELLEYCLGSGVPFVAQETHRAAADMIVDLLERIGRGDACRHDETTRGADLAERQQDTNKRSEELYRAMPD